MSFMNAIQSMLPRPENRSRDQIARDVEDELAFHLEMRTRAIESEEGVDRSTAGELARTRFGNVDRIRNECQRIALKERNMLQRVNFIMMLVVLMMVAIVGWQVLRTQAKTAEALIAITGDLQRMKYEATTAASEKPGGLVFLNGAVTRTGVYRLPADGTLTIARLITLSGGISGDEAGAYVQIKRRNGESGWRIFSYKLDDAGIGDFVLQNDDEITVTLAVDLRQFPAATAVPVGAWTQIDERGKPLPGGAKIETLASDDVRNTVGLPIGILTLPGDAEKYRLAFEDGSSPTNLRVQRMSNRINLSNGRWELRSDVLTVNLAPALPAQDEPLRFAYKAAASAPAASDTRAEAVGDFVVRLFALADPNNPNLDQTIREFLDAEEKAVDLRYADDPATAGMIRELIAARRKIFESDAAIQRAATAEAQAAAIADFLKDTLTAVDSNAPAMHASDVLDSASRRVDEEFADNPQVAAQLRERIAEARKALDAPSTSQPESASAGGMSDAELQKFIPRLMTASIPNSAASTLPTLEELNRAASSIDIAYANDPTLLAKLHGMVETVRKRLDSAPPQSPTTSPGG